MNPFRLVWQAPEYEHRPKEVGWYWLSIISAVVLLGIALWQKNFLFAVFIVVAEILLMLWGGREPQMLTFELTERGLDIHGLGFYALGDMASWSADSGDSGDWAEVVFSFKQHLKPGVRVKMPKQNLALLAQNLKGHLPQGEMRTSFVDTLERFFHF